MRNLYVSVQDIPWFATDIPWLDFVVSTLVFRTVLLVIELGPDCGNLSDN
jgi:hypothetical protein